MFSMHNAYDVKIVKLNDAHSVHCTLHIHSSVLIESTMNTSNEKHSRAQLECK